MDPVAQARLVTIISTIECIFAEYKRIMGFFPIKHQSAGVQCANALLQYKLLLVARLSVVCLLFNGINPRSVGAPRMRDHEGQNYHVESVSCFHCLRILT